MTTLVCPETPEPGSAGVRPVRAAHLMGTAYWRWRAGPGATPSLQALLDAFNAHDVEAIMSFFTEDCVFDMPRGPGQGDAG